MGLILQELERRRQREIRLQSKDFPRFTEFIEKTSEIILEDWQIVAADRLEKLRYQKGQRILLHKPPQHGGSMILQRLPAYMIGCDPEIRVRDVTYNQTHSERFSALNLAIMQSEAYKEMFPAVRLPKVCPVGQWSTDQRAARKDAQSSFSALGLGSGFVGTGGDLILIDDPYADREDAYSEKINANIWNWRQDVLTGRMNPDTNVVVMFHRWQENDFAGRLIAEGGWEMWRFAALADGQDDPMNRPLDQPLSPKRYPYAYLDAIRQKNPIGFAGLYQGTPRLPEGNVLKVDRILPAAEPFGPGVEEATGWDLGASEALDADRTSCTRAKVHNGLFYICEVRSGQWEPNTRDNLIKSTTGEFQQNGRDCKSWIEEPFGIAVSVSTDIKKKLLGLNFEMVPPRKGKETRAQPFQAAINAGLVRICKTGNPAKDAWIHEYLMELAAFPLGTHEDRVDSTTLVFDKLVVIDEWWRQYGVY
jgi:predicted phage terminase large subunit-like protein